MSIKTIKYSCFQETQVLKEGRKEENKPEAYNMYTDIACLNNVMTLSCLNDRTITVTKAHWGQYNLARDEGTCCAPNPAYDCTVDMETVEPTVFELIKLECDGQQSCDLDFIAYEVNECQVCRLRTGLLRLSALWHEWTGWILSKNDN